MEALPPPRMVCPLTTMLNIQYPVLLAGMANISMPNLAAAVCNAGGLGVVGGAFITPATLRAHLRELKSLLRAVPSPYVFIEPAATLHEVRQAIEQQKQGPAALQHRPDQFTQRILSCQPFLAPTIFRQGAIPFTTSSC